jgi:hypothetical protein
MFLVFVADATALDTGSNITGLYVHIPTDVLDGEGVVQRFEVGKFVGFEVTCLKLIVFEDTPPGSALLIARFVSDNVLPF